MDFDGRNVSQLTRHQSICLSPAFLRMGQKLLLPPTSPETRYVPEICALREERRIAAHTV